MYRNSRFVLQMEGLRVFLLLSTNNDAGFINTLFFRDKKTHLTLSVPHVSYCCQAAFSILSHDIFSFEGFFSRSTGLAYFASL